MEPPRLLQGTVIERSARAKSWLLGLVTAEEGFLRIIARQSSRKGATPVPDLFESGEFRVESSRSGGGLAFLRDFRLLDGRPGIARHYEGFRRATEFLRLMRQHPSHPESACQQLELVDRALDAWSAGAPPAAVHLKALFRFAQLEGYPVEERWLEQLPGNTREQTRRVLQTPASAIEAGSADMEARVRSLSRWVSETTEIAESS